jgi:hypothetical protein
MGISPLNIFETVEILEVKGFVVEWTKLNPKVSSTDQV